VRPELPACARAPAPDAPCAALVAPEIATAPQYRRSQTFGNSSARAMRYRIASTKWAWNAARWPFFQSSDTALRTTTFLDLAAAFVAPK